MNSTDRRIIQWGAIIGAFLMAGLNSCTDDLGIEDPRPSDVVCFSASLGSDSSIISTRSTANHLSIVEEEWRLEGMPVDTVRTRAALTTSLTGQAGVIAYNGDGILTDLNNR